jgi:hypothetical protein
MDEFGSEFQASIFARGDVIAKIPLEWQPYEDALTPVFITLDPAGHTWVTSYWPVFALLLAPFKLLGLPGLLNPLLAGGSVALIAVVARQIFDRDADRTFAAAAPWLAALLLIASPQFLVMAMTSYAMSAHLFFNLLWLYLFLRGDRISLALVPWVGVLALGLHKPNVHAMFVLPFCLRVVRDRRWWTSLYFAVIYLFGLWLCYLWMKVGQPQGAVEVTTASGAGAMFNWPSWRSVTPRLAYLSLFFAWQAVAVSVFAATAILYWRRLTSVQRDLALGALALFVFYFVGRGDQGHGWGYRYLHAVVGNVILLAVAGCGIWRELAGRKAATWLAGTAIAVGLIVELPVRCFQVEDFVRPFADSDRFLSAQGVDYELIDPQAAWYAHDLVRNDPFLRSRPVRLFATALTQPQVDELARKYRGGLIDPREFYRRGIFPIRKVHDDPLPPPSASDP